MRVLASDLRKFSPFDSRRWLAFPRELRRAKSMDSTSRSGSGENRQKLGADDGLSAEKCGSSGTGPLYTFGAASPGAGWADDGDAEVSAAKFDVYGNVDCLVSHLNSPPRLSDEWLRCLDSYPREFEIFTGLLTWNAD